MEILTHGSHQHEAAEMVQHEMHGQGTMDEMGLNGVQSANGEGMGLDIEDCLCDDICCVSSVVFGPGVDDEHISLIAQSLLGNPDFYSSVFLDLLLPPPTV